MDITDDMIVTFDAAYMVCAETHVGGDGDTSERCCIAAGIERVAPLIAAQALREAAAETDEQWGLRYRLNGVDQAPGHGGHVFDSRADAQIHIDVWRVQFRNLSYTDVRFARRTVWTGPWEDAGAEGQP